MKKILLLSLIILFSCSKKNNFNWSKLSLDEILASNNNKIIFLDFYSDN